MDFDLNEDQSLLRDSVERLAAAGFDATATARIHAPIGLDIGAVSPAEIALAILGEIVSTLRGPRRASA